MATLNWGQYFLEPLWLLFLPETHITECRITELVCFKTCHITHVCFSMKTQFFKMVITNRLIIFLVLELFTVAPTITTPRCNNYIWFCLLRYCYRPYIRPNRLPNKMDSMITYLILWPGIQPAIRSWKCTISLLGIAVSHTLQLTSTVLCWTSTMIVRTCLWGKQ